MASKGTFVLADIGGYTSFLSGVAIEHGTEITEDLLNTVLRCNRNRWKLANVEGDCIFFYTEGDEPPAELIGHIRNIYKEFCERIIAISERAACPCGACTRTGELSLKFIVHAGEFETQKIANRTELVGSDVITAHRLLKNSAPLDEYVIVTDTYAELPESGDLPASRGADEYEHSGGVDYSVLDLSPVRDEVRSANWIFIDPDEARFTIDVSIDAPRERVWTALTDNNELLKWDMLEEGIELPPPRAAAGDLHRCVFPDGSTLVRLPIAIEPDQFRYTERWHISRLIKDMIVTRTLTNDGKSTVVTCSAIYEGAMPPLTWLFTPVFGRVCSSKLQESLERLKAYCEQPDQQ